MDVLKIGHMLQSAASLANSSQPNAFNSTMLEWFIPGYGIISKLLYDWNLGQVIPLLVLAIGLYTGACFLWVKIPTLFEYAASCASIPDYDPLFAIVLAWVSAQDFMEGTRKVRVVSEYAGSSEESVFEDENAVGENELFNFAKLAANIPPQYEPALGTYYFRWRGHFFIFERSRRDRGSTIAYAHQPEEEQIQLKNFRSTKPIQELLQHIKKWHTERSTSKTTIRRPAPHESRGYQQNPWTIARTRHSRPMKTVVLDEEQKDKLVVDMNEFLLPSSPRWYATRGIPYRRGYLLHGPPGTGKSSLSFALAGLFGLDIHVLSLRNPAMNDAQLNHLFSTLPTRCLVLLEDIDTAGLKRDTEPSSNIAVDIVERVSLSGLLNAIDGVASQEGRILVMTTNDPEKLDPALVRPGRVDVRVDFNRATHQQVKEIFFNMYSRDSNTEEGIESGAYEKQVRDMAGDFAEKLPENTFSLAEVQNFLIERKKNPRMAVEQAETLMRLQNEAFR